MTWNLFCDHSKRREDWERSIFVRLKEGGYRLRENILFHLYVSTSPCGDARLNSPYEITTDCKKKIFPFLFPLCVGGLFFFFKISPSFFLYMLAENVSLESRNTPGCVACVCLCSWCLVPCTGGRYAGKIGARHGSGRLFCLPEAQGLCWGIHPQQPSRKCNPNSR